ncbi:ciliary microtubule-associated protein 3-like [Symsagittifera roscoffensis]|uniref:ciliary microtubule-associated protein 3-like n=1 Tax=Symsagittifera roscoffensis TaxID=84072 RepID=UPI00307C49A2
MPALITQLTLQDILEGEKESNVCFHSCQDRRLYPGQPAFDRLGNQHNVNSTPPVVGPGTYPVSETSDFVRLLEKRPGRSESILGVGISGRTGPFRIPLASKEKLSVPSPVTYQRDLTRLSESAGSEGRRSYKPFGSAATRKSVVDEQQTRGPPPGAHDVHLHNGKLPQIERHCSFGGDQFLRTPLRTAKEPGMRKTFSGGDLRKFRWKEAYLSLYWPTETSSK